MSALEIVGLTALWLIGLAASFYVPAILCMLRPGGLEVLAMGWRMACISAALYVMASMIYFAAT